MSDDKPQDKPVETKPVVKECDCVKTETPKAEVPKVEIPKETKPAEVIADQKPATGIDMNNLQNYNDLQLKIAALETELKGMKVAPKPEATVPKEQTSNDLKKIGEKMLKEMREDGHFTMEIPYDTVRSFGVQPVKTSSGLRESYSHNYLDNSTPIAIHETASSVTYTGTHPGLDIDNNVQIVPGGLTWAPTRQFCRYKAVPQGFNTAKWFKTTLPSPGSQTPGTTPTAGSQTITAIDVVPSTVTGSYQLIDTDKMEDEPYDVINTVINAASNTVLNFEATDMLSTVSAEGTLTPGRWINGNTGASTPNSDVSGAFKRLGISKARQYLENQGYLRGGQRPVAFLHPQQMEELAAEDTTISTFLQYANPSYTATGVIPTLHGVDLYVSNAVQAPTNTTNNAYNALVFMPQFSYAAASKRDVLVKMHEYGEDNQWRVNVTWRYKTGVIDANSIVRASSAQ